MAWEFSQALAEEMSSARQARIFITNLLRGPRRTGNPRDGTTTDEMLMPYLGQYRVERAFRAARSKLEADSVCIHRPSGANVFVFVVFLGMIVAGIIDAVIRKEGLRKTTESMIGDLSSHRQIRQI